MSDYDEAVRNLLSRPLKARATKADLVQRVSVLEESLALREAEVERLREALREVGFMTVHCSHGPRVRKVLARLAQSAGGRGRCPACGHQYPTPDDPVRGILLACPDPFHTAQPTEGQERDFIDELEAERPAIAFQRPDRCPSCGLSVRILMAQGAHGCPDPYHEPEDGSDER